MENCILDGNDLILTNVTFNPRLFDVYADIYSKWFLPPSDLTHKIKVNNQNIKKSKEIELPKKVSITDVIINGDATILKNGNGKIILKKSKDDEYNIEYAFLYGYFLMNSGLSKTQASKFFKELRGVIDETKDN